MHTFAAIVQNISSHPIFALPNTCAPISPTANAGPHPKHTTPNRPASSWHNTFSSARRRKSDTPTGYPAICDNTNTPPICGFFRNVRTGISLPICNAAPLFCRIFEMTIQPNRDGTKVCRHRLTRACKSMVISAPLPAKISRTLTSPNTFTTSIKRFHPDNPFTLLS